jgi:2-keto-3-deoxy-6-phosphogluconate aldolase
MPARRKRVSTPARSSWSAPGFDRETVELARSAGALIMAGGLTPTEVITAWKAGADFIKVFPCRNVGGPAYIKSLKAALPQIPMIPTGGVNLATAGAFLDAGAAALGVGGELFRRPLCVREAGGDHGSGAPIPGHCRQERAEVTFGPRRT